MQHKRPGIRAACLFLANADGLSVIGRNLLMLTNCSGYNPDVVFASNSASFRIDQFAYPVFRTYTAALQFRF